MEQMNQEQAKTEAGQSINATVVFEDRMKDLEERMQQVVIESWQGTRRSKHEVILNMLSSSDPFDVFFLHLLCPLPPALLTFQNVKYHSVKIRNPEPPT